MNLRIELSQNPTEEERTAILAPLRAHNVANAGPSTFDRSKLDLGARINPIPCQTR